MAIVSTATEQGKVRSGSKQSAYSWYVLGVLGCVSLANYYDRNLISILVEPIKRDLRLSDAQIGLLSGFAFALAYSVFGVPVARLADRYGRTRILSLALAAWSAMTVLTGRTADFLTMLLARAGVATGEAGGLPATHALVADYFGPERRGTALSVIGVCGALGASLAVAGGGLINEWRGWRTAFFLGGIVGLVLAIVLWSTVSEPARAPVNASQETRRSASLTSTFRTLWGRRSYLHLCVGLAICAVGAYGQFAWAPTFFMRSYHLSTAQVGGYYSAAVGPATLVSIVLGGVLNDWLLKRRKSAPLWILAVTFGLTVPASLLFLLVHHLLLAMSMAVVTTVLGSLWIGPSYALVQSLSGPALRATAAAIFMMAVNIVGLGLGPYLTGLLSDALAVRFGDQALALSLSVVTAFSGLGVIHFLIAMRTVEADMAAAEGSVPPDQP
jgi:predicted MFS family arabinose efflux permease